MMPQPAMLPSQHFKMTFKWQWCPHGNHEDSVSSSLALRPGYYMQKPKREVTQKCGLLLNHTLINI